MKRKSAKRVSWRLVTARRFAVEHLDTAACRGQATLLCLDAVREPLWVPCAGGRLCVADRGFSWLQQFPERAHDTVTAMFDADDGIVQWYVDICKAHGIDERGIPWFDDLYLDPTILPGGASALLDAEELDEALRQRRISRDDYDPARREAARLAAGPGRGELARLQALGPAHRGRLLRRLGGEAPTGRHEAGGGS